MNLIEGLLQQIDRNEELLKTYDEIPTGVFGARMIRLDIKKAKEAMGSGDTVEMMRCYKELENNK